MTEADADFGILRAGLGAIAYSRLVPVFLRDYYAYCLNVLRQAMGRGGVSLNVMFNNHHTAFPEALPVAVAMMQPEHTLARPLGFDPATFIPGGIPFGDTGRNYLVRIERYADLCQADLVFEYSRPNIANIESCPVFTDYLRRVAYVSPSIFPVDLGATGRDIDILMLGHVSERRRALIERAEALGLRVTCISGAFDPDAVRALYRRTRILLNTRQTDVFDTLEELRVLPALRCGALVVSEDVPLRETVPYHRHVVWAAMDDLAQTLHRIAGDYAAAFDRHIAAPGLPALLATIEARDVDNVAEVLGRALTKAAPPAPSVEPEAAPAQEPAPPSPEQAAFRVLDAGPGPIDLARGCPTRQSSGDPAGERSGAAVSGVFTGSFAFSTECEPNPWWEVDLGAVLPIGSIAIWNRDDAYLNGAERARPMRVSTSRDGTVWETLWFSRAVFGARSFGAPLRIETLLPVMARYVRIALERTEYLHLDQVEVFLALPELSFGQLARLRVDDRGAVATVQIHHDSGFFSVCSAVLETILRLQSWGILTEAVDTSRTHGVSRDAGEPPDVHAALFGPARAVALPDLESRAVTRGPFQASHCHWHYRSLDFAAVVPFVHRHFTPAPDNLALEEQLLAEHGLDPDRMIAIYYRGTDKSSEVAPTDISRFIAEAERILCDEPDLRILVQTDQAQVRDAITAHFGPRSVFFASLPVTTGAVGLHHDARDMKTEFGIGRFEMARHFLAAVRIMARARHVITGTSNVALWIALYRGSTERLRQFDAEQDLIVT